MVYDGRQQIRTLFILLVGVFWSAFLASAAQEPYDIDLKELRRPPVRKVKEQRAPRAPEEPVPAATGENGENSSYTVRQGDHLFIILMKRYGLSNDAAEQLIPEIMRLNGIRNPKSLSVGQRLLIPLQSATVTAINTSSKKNRQKPHRSHEPQSAAERLYAADTPHMREVVASASKPCLLAREVAEKLGMRVSSLSPFADMESISISNDVVKMVMVCGLEPAEAYTIERLLAQHDVKLLVFKADEKPRAVIEGLANSLKIIFRLSDANTTAELPLTYLFPAHLAGKDLRLTIRPDAPPLK